MGLTLLRSRAAGFVLVAILSFALVSVARSLWPSGTLRGPRLEKVPEPALDSIQAVPRREIQAARAAAGAALSQPGATAQQRAAAYGQLGTVYLAYSLRDAAAACYRNAAALDLQAFQWPYLLAHALEGAGQPDAASAAMQSALDRMPHDAHATPQDHLAARCFLAEAAIRKDQREEARRHLEAALESSPRAPYPLVRLGQLLARAGQSGPAAGYFDRAAAVMPGRRDWMQGQLQAGAGPMPIPPFPYADPLSASVRDLDHSTAGLIRLGDARIAQGKRREALEYFRRAAEADPASAAARQRHAEALLAEGRADEARRELEEAVRRDPANRRARAALAIAYAGSPATRDQALAIAAGFRREPLQNQPLQNLSSVYVSAGRYAEALAVCRDAASLYPDEAWPVLGEGAMLAALGRHADARAAFDRGVRYFPGTPRARLILARYLVTAANPSARDARLGLEIANQLLAVAYNPARAETVAIALAANGRYPAAIETLNRAIARGGDGMDAAMRSRFERVLRSFQSRKPWTEPWPFHTAAFAE